MENKGFSAGEGGSNNGNQDVTEFNGENQAAGEFTNASEPNTANVPGDSEDEHNVSESEERQENTYEKLFTL